MFQKFGGIDLDVDKLSPWLLVARKSLHELCIAIDAGMLAANIGVQGIIIDLGLGEDVLRLYFPYIHG